MKTTTWILLIAFILAALAAGLIRLATRGTLVGAVAVAPGPIQQVVDERGLTRLPETYLITMPFPGRIGSIELVEGTLVRRGQVVARVVQRDVELEVQQAAAAVERLQAAIEKNADNTVEKTLLLQSERFVESMRSAVEAAAERVKAGLAKTDYAEKHLGRIQQLFESAAVSEEEKDRALLQKIEAAVDYRQDELVHAAMVALQAATDLMPTMVQQYIDRKQLDEAVLVKQKAEAEAVLHQVLENQRRSVMTSPVDGVVLRRHVTNERFLPAGTPLLEIGRLEDLEVEADVLSLDVVDVRPGDPVEIYGPTIGTTPAQGSVSRIEPAGFTKISSLGVEQQRVKVIIHFNPDHLARLRREKHLGVGYRVRVRIVTAQKADALLIPRSALFRGPSGQWQLFAVVDGRARITGVRIGLINDQLAEVVAGLSPGDLVIAAPE
ncbi:MAG TPA: HlyD family efflux transporter periplasmic adaptor subunit, partial [Planctomycetaceae bacterium]|nr:HlyD family efflux transporter periplasmic adaptor subunit [Planctomycetaceae bacterium]